MPYGLWMLQRLLDEWRSMEPVDAEKVRLWAAKYGAVGLFELDMPRIKRHGLSVAAEIDP